MTKYVVARYMTVSPHTVGRDQTLTVAHRIMRDHRVRHLPVLDAGKLVGLVSDRDLHVVESLEGVDPTCVRVEDAMATEPYVVAPEQPLLDVVAEMARRKYGSAIVADDGHVVGVFTTVDALKLLHSMLARSRSAGGLLIRESGQPLHESRRS